MTFVREARAAGRGRGFKPWPAAPARRMSAPGSRWYAVNRDRTIAAFVIGTDPAVGAARASSTRTTTRCTSSSSPGRSARASTSRCSTRSTHGGMKNYQWVNRPLALIGRVIKTDGTSRERRHRPRTRRSRADHRRPRAARGRATSWSRTQPRRHPDRGARSDPGARPREAAAQALKEKYGLTPRRFSVGRSADRPGADAGRRRARSAAGRRLRPRRPFERVCRVPRDHRSAGRPRRRRSRTA